MFPNKNLAAVKNNSFFRDIDSSNFKINLNIKYFVEVGEGEIIYHSGDPTEYLYLIIEGEVKLKIPGASSSSSLLLKKVKDNYFGEKEIQENSPRLSYALANKNSLLYRIRKSDLNSVTWLNKKLSNIPGEELVNEGDTGRNKRESIFDGLIDNLPGKSFFNPESIYSEEDGSQVNKPEDETDIKEKIEGTLETESLNSDLATDIGSKNFEEEFINQPQTNPREILAGETASINGTYLDNEENIAEVKENEVEPIDEIDHEKLERMNFFVVNQNISKNGLKEEVVINNAGSSEEEILDITNRLKSLNQLANFLIHDIDNPIQSIRQYSEHIKKQNINKEINHILDMIIEQSTCVTDLVQATLKYSEEKTISNLEPLIFSNVLDHILIILAEYVESRDVKLFKKFEGDGIVNIDRNMFYQVCFQIAKNACDAMPNGGNIYITTKKDEDKLRIEIKDNGFGIPDSIKDKIFEPFMTHGKKNRIGLGLSIAEKIILEHNGTIRAESDLGEGSAILIVLPILD